jgi:hypothetical protein
MRVLPDASCPARQDFVEFDLGDIVGNARPGKHMLACDAIRPWVGAQCACARHRPLAWTVRWCGEPDRGR